MRKTLPLFLLAVAAFGEPAYEKVASVKQLMAAVVKPAMDSNAAMNKAGGPKDDAEWDKAAANAALFAEVMELMQMGGRSKDDVWSQTAGKSFAGAQAVAKAAAAKDLDAWQKALPEMGSGCRGCHEVHRMRKKG